MSFRHDKPPLKYKQTSKRKGMRVDDFFVVARLFKLPHTFCMNGNKAFLDIRHYSYFSTYGSTNNGFFSGDLFHLITYYPFIHVTARKLEGMYDFVACSSQFVQSQHAYCHYKRKRKKKS